MQERDGVVAGSDKRYDFGGYSVQVRNHQDCELQERSKLLCFL